MEKLVDFFCHAIRITDPLSIKIAVGVIGGGIPLLFLSALFILSASLWPSSEKPQCPPHTDQPVARDASAGGLLPSVNKATVSQTDRPFLVLARATRWANWSMTQLRDLFKNKSDMAIECPATPPTGGIEQAPPSQLSEVERRAYSNSGQTRARSDCPLSANSGLMHCNMIGKMLILSLHASLDFRVRTERLPVRWPLSHNCKRYE